MPSGADGSGLDRLNKRLLYLSDAMKSGSTERRNLERDVEQIVTSGVKDALLAGKDENGREFAKLAPSTLEDRKRRGISGTTPFITRGQQSSILTALRTRWETSGAQRILRTFWDLDWLKYHEQATRNRPARRPGIPPDTMKRVKDRVGEYAAMLRKKLAG